jgi:hypothetical protein
VAQVPLGSDHFLIVLGIVSAGSILFTNMWRVPSIGLSAMLHGIDDVLFWAAIVIVLSHPKSRNFLGLSHERQAASATPINNLTVS